jgi:hypothetical protein
VQENLKETPAAFSHESRRRLAAVSDTRKPATPTDASQWPAEIVFEMEVNRGHSAARRF